MSAGVQRWDDVEILVVGAGTMGASLAQNYAQNGFSVGLLDLSAEYLDRGFASITRELEAATGRIFTPSEAAAIRGRIIGTTSYDDACAGKNLRLVIEAATERIDIKKNIFACLDSLTAPQVVLATNSSSLDTNILAQSTRRPEKVVWTHFFYLPHKNRAAEYAGTDAASAGTMAIAREYLKLGGKIPTLIRGSRKGGVADIIFVALLLEATRMLEEGYSAPEIESAGKSAFGMPVGFLGLMDATGLPVGLASMRSFSDSSDPGDPLYRVYGNFFEPRQNYIDLVANSSAGWLAVSASAGPGGGQDAPAAQDPRSVRALTERFLAICFLTATECVDAGLIGIGDLELLAQNAFLWHKGPFTLMNEMGMAKVAAAVARRMELGRASGQHIPLPGLLKKQIDSLSSGRPRAAAATAASPSWPVAILPVFSETERDGAVRRITLSNPRAANAMDNCVFAELERQFGEADEDDRCKVIIFDTAPIKTFIAGADVRSFVERVKAGDFDAIRRDTERWQQVLFHVMTGRSTKPRIAIVDGQAFGGGAETACAFALDPCSIVLITNRTSFSFPETRLGIYPGLRGTLTLAQLIYRKTGDPEASLALARYYILAGGIAASSPRLLFHMGCADAIVPQHRRDQAAGAIAGAIIANGGNMISSREIDELPFERLGCGLLPEEATEFEVARDLFSQADLIPTLVAQARGHCPIFYSGEMKRIAERAARRVAANSPNAVRVSDYLVARGFEGFLAGVANETLAAFELEHYLTQVFEHPDALIGLEAMLGGKFPEFRRRYPL